MLIERTNKEIIIRLSASIDTQDLQDLLNYARYKELTANVNTDKKMVDKITNDINAKWWTKNRNKVIKRKLLLIQTLFLVPSLTPIAELEKYF